MLAARQRPSSREQSRPSDNHPAGAGDLVHAKRQVRATARLSQVETRVRIPLGLPRSLAPSEQVRSYFPGCRPRYLSVPGRAPFARCLMARIVHDRRYRGAGGRDSGSRGKTIGVIGSTAQSHVREGGARSLSCETHPGRRPQPLRSCRHADHEVLLGRMRVDAGRRSRDPWRRTRQSSSRRCRMTSMVGQTKLVDRAALLDTATVEARIGPVEYRYRRQA